MPLLLDAYQLWAELEQLTGKRLYVQTGLLQAGPADGVVVPGVLRSASQHNLPIDRLSSHEANQRFPMFKVPADHIAAFEHRAGYLFVEQCVATHLQVAQDHGAQLLTNCAVRAYSPEGSGYRITTTQGDVLAERIVITVGAWLPNWLSAAIKPLQVLRKHLHWFHSSDPRVLQSQGCPLFFFENSTGCFYGFPAIDDAWGLKVAEHSGGEEMSDPTLLDRNVDSLDRARIDAFVQATFHGTHAHQRHDVCMYTMTADGHFAIDWHPEHTNILIAGGFSGHGFKFAAVLGKEIARSVLTGGLDDRLRFLGFR